MKYCLKNNDLQFKKKFAKFGLPPKLSSNYFEFKHCSSEEAQSFKKI